MTRQEPLEISDDSRRLLRWVLTVFSLVEAAVLALFVYKVLH